MVKGYTIAQRGDAILEFANVQQQQHHDGDDSGGRILRFRVSSHMLAETSPYFARLFLDSASSSSTRTVPLPRTVVLPGSNETLKLYSVPVPSSPPNRHDALSILLYAAHMQTDKVPRTVTFAQFVAIAETCLQYECTSPLEVFVEHLWLPAWVHMAATNHQKQGGGGLLLISYVFGLRRLFTRMSKTAILTVVDEEDLGVRSWPRKLKERIWAMRNAKMAQVQNACAGAVQEYLRPPAHDDAHTAETRPSTIASQQAAAKPPIQRRTTTISPSNNDQQPVAPSYESLFSPSSTPRCPKGSHACDAANLGWLLLVFNDLQLLNPPLFPQQQQQQRQSPPPPSTPRQSISQLLDALRFIPPSPSVHLDAGTTCDPATALRAIVNDIYNSLSGLTLFEVDGKRHGWALSKGKAGEPQSLLTTVSLGVLEMGEDGPGSTQGGDAAGGGGAAAAMDVVLTTKEESDIFVSIEETRHPQRAPSPPCLNETVCLHILSHLDTSEDLYSAALTSRTFYAALKNNELILMHHLVRAHRRMTLHVLGGERKSSPAVFADPNIAARTWVGGIRGMDKTLRGSYPRARPQSLPSPLSSTTTSPHILNVDCKRPDAVEPRSLMTWRSPPWRSITGPNESISLKATPNDIDTVHNQSSLSIRPPSAHTMTEEDARRILWPDYALASVVSTTYIPNQAVSSNSPPNKYPTNYNTDKWKSPEPTTDYTSTTLSNNDNVGATSVKFLADNKLNILRLVEDKTLLVLGDKTLREHLDKRIGIGDSG